MRSSLLPIPPLENLKYDRDYRRGTINLCTDLHNQHAVEDQAIELLERQLARLENYPAIADRMRQHIEESRGQALRLEQLLAEPGSSESGLKDTVMSFMGNLTLADINAHGAAVAALKQLFSEEEAIATWIDQHIEATTRTFVSRSSAGQTAGR